MKELGPGCGAIAAHTQSMRGRIQAGTEHGTAYNGLSGPAVHDLPANASAIGAYLAAC